MENKYHNESWKRLSLGDFDNGIVYKISNYGRVKSFAFSEEGKFLKGGVVQGYRTMSFSSKEGLRITKYIHKLVAEHFLTPLHDDEVYVIHLDFNKQNNHDRNLRWVAKKEKEAHQNVNPAFVASKKTVKYAKLNISQVMLIKRALRSKTVPLKSLVNRFGITYTQVKRIESGENWSSVELED